MRGHLHGLLAGAAFALYAAAGVAAFAQPAPPPGGPEGPPGARHMHGPQARDPAEHAAHLRDVLQLKPAQEPALQAFVTALQSARSGMGPARPPGPPPATTPERLDAMQQGMARRQAAMTTVIDATRRFYAQLDPAQKRAFDALPPPAMGGGGMMGPPGPPPPPR
jgi:hypothetical protein